MISFWIFSMKSFHVNKPSIMENAENIDNSYLEVNLEECVSWEKKEKETCIEGRILKLREKGGNRCAKARF